MSMITGCPACGTMFRVVPDQLKISEGWVRCGRCGEVFDATGSLQSDARPDIPPSQAALHSEGAGVPVPAGPPEPPPVSQLLAHESRPAADPQGTTGFEAATGGSAVASVAMAAELPAGASGAWDSQPAAVASRFDGQDDRVAQAEADEAGSQDSGEVDTRLQDVSFVRQARRQAFWRRSPVRFALLLAVLVLAGLLALQFAVRERDRLALAQPQLRPLLEQACERLGCSISAPRRIEAIVIDSSGFTRLRPDVYRLSFTLKNQSPLPVAAPALQLTLTDSQEQAVVQRVLLPRELGAAPATIGAASEWSASVALAVSPGNGDAASVAGYRLLAFYP